ncbi:hypothetical protein NT01EI_2780 [Edwardsiella ictaluri 93-146]|uniref:Uncharacterized protein n=1 Tax=Edwardsiella ictaluri (strain 93-146) TaxID=634503 RepID=C5BAH7_EDWI9|nr:hypothetical protein NT01EI_2780 [Edwardsiella ictaluri 93-146]
MVDDFNREALSIEIDLNLSATVSRLCTRQDRGKPRLSGYDVHG